MLRFLSAPGPRWSAIRGGVLGAWATLWLVIYGVASDLLVDAGHESTLHLLEGQAQDRWGWTAGWPTAVALLGALLIIGGILGGALLSLLARALGMDPANLANASVAWAWRLVWRFWPIPIGMLFAFVLISAWGGHLVWGVAILALALVNFLTTRRESLEIEPAQWRWRWNWPGRQAFLVSVVLAMLAEGVDKWLASSLLEALLPRSWPVIATVAIVAIPAYLWFVTATGLVQSGLWVDRPAARADFRRTLAVAFRWTWLGPLFAQGVLFSAPSAMFAPLLLLAPAFTIYDAAEMEMALRDGGPWFAGQVLDGVQLWSRFGLAWTMALLVLPAALAANRLWVCLSRHAQTN